MGSFHLWMARHLYSFRARQILISNGQQTLGVALPWAIAATLVRPSEKVLSISGDGGFLFSAMELETAVRLKSNLVHMILIDGSYDMVAEQEILKYGRPSGTDFGPVDPVKYAEAFGAKGLMIQSPDQIPPVLKQAFDTPGPVLWEFTSTIAITASCLSKSMSEAFTKAKCFRDSDYITAEAQRTFGDNITARLQLVPEIDSRAKMPIARPQTRKPREDR